MLNSANILEILRLHDVLCCCYCVRFVLALFKEFYRRVSICALAAVPAIPALLLLD